MTITTKFNIGDIVWYKNNGYIFKGKIQQIIIKQQGGWGSNIYYDVVCDYSTKRCLAEHELHTSQDRL
jgi:hypothetical protein